MAIVNKVDLKLKVDIDNSIKYQIITFCFFERIIISHSDLKVHNLVEMHYQKQKRKI